MRRGRGDARARGHASAGRRAAANRSRRARKPGFASLSVYGRAPSARQRQALTTGVRHVLRLDDDLSHFYRLAASDPALAWAAAGAGRMIRSPSVFEDVVKTICTTNCAWSATVRMVGALVEHLGERAVSAAADGSARADLPDAGGDGQRRRGFLPGHRSRWLPGPLPARSRRRGSFEGLSTSSRSADPELPEPELEGRLLALPGVGPYAAAHVMMLLGRHSLLVLDSWTRPKYARITGGRPVKDATIVRRFRRYGRFAGLAFWLTVTDDWA